MSDPNVAERPHHVNARKPEVRWRAAFCRRIALGPDFALELPPQDVEERMREMESSLQQFAELLLKGVRFKDLDFANGLIFIRSGKGDKDR